MPPDRFKSADAARKYFSDFDPEAGERRVALLAALNTGDIPYWNTIWKISAFRRCRYQVVGGRRARFVWLDLTRHNDPRSALQRVLGSADIVKFQVVC